MTQSRKNIVSLEATPYYHCTSRCVRRAFLCGKDLLTGRNMGHRKKWFETRLDELQQAFSIKIAAYAIMSNHYHLVVFIDEESKNKWSMDQVISRWCQLFKGPLWIQKYLRKERMSSAEMYAVDQTAELWRSRLSDLSWFIRCLNEHIARKANCEDNCTGRFWEGRFKSQALLDEQAVLTCMAYVDLNPIRAKMARTLERSGFTSIQKRIQRSLKTTKPNRQDQQPKNLLPFIGHESNLSETGIHLLTTDYFELVDWTGRQFKHNQHGIIPHNVPPILDRLGIAHDQWLILTNSLEKKFRVFIGTKASLQKARFTFKRKKMHGITWSQTLFP